MLKKVFNTNDYNPTNPKPQTKPKNKTKKTTLKALCAISFNCNNQRKKKKTKIVLNKIGEVVGVR